MASTAPATTAADDNAPTTTAADDNAPTTTAAADNAPTTTEAESRHGGTLVHLHGFEAPSLDVLLGRADTGTASDAVQLNAIYDVLFYEDRSTTELTMQMAESFESPDGINWRLKLKPGILFTDGTPLNAEAVKFNWERIADPANGSRNASGPGQIASMTVVDDLTLDITLKSANGQFGRDLAATAPWIASPTAIRSAGTDYGVSTAVGAGPFVLETWSRDSELVLTRNENYWNAPLPYLDKLIIRQIPDPDARFNTWASGDADSSYTSTAVALAPRAEAEGGVLYDTGGSVGGLAYILNTTVSPFNDVRARLAFTKAVDRELLSQVVSEGLNDPVDHIVRQPSPFYNPDAKIVYDPEAAQALFDELAAEGAALSFTLVTTAAGLPATEAIQAQLLAYDNVSVEIEQIENTVIAQRHGSGDFQAIITAVTGFDPSLLGDSWITGSPRNSGKYSNAEMDAAIKLQRESTDPSERKAAVDQMQRIFVEEAPWFFFTATASYWFASPDVKGLELPRQGPLWERVWLEQS